MSRTAGDASLVEACARCEAIVRVRARNFWYGLRLTPEPKRSAMYAIYAWMREADDIADAGDQSASERRARLDRFRENTDRALAGDAPISSGSAEGPCDAMWKALAAIAPEYDLDRKDFHDMLAGQLADLEAVRLNSWDELRTQCYRVASTVGLVCVRVWGYADPSVIERAQQLAIDRGIAFQLTNILRDVREDRANGRVYLPEDELRAAGLDIDSLVAWRDDRRCGKFLREQIARAQEHYRRSSDLESLISPECVPTLWALTRIYRRLLDRIAADPQAVVGAGRVRVATWEKLWIGFRAKRMAKTAQRSHARSTGELAAEIAAP